MYFDQKTRVINGKHKIMRKILTWFCLTAFKIVNLFGEKCRYYKKNNLYTISFCMIIKLPIIEIHMQCELLGLL